ncbi:MAG: MFS transporter [Anaerolineae bacterium]|nr:MFS transporter [Anaerolineae bacterium]MCI0610291.1 MFS transporter [Anaerolineae bacterium]
MKNQLWQVFSLLYRYPAFGRLWVGRLISLFGDAFTLIALPWFVLQLTGSGTATAGILLTLQLPAIITSMVIGSLIDRFQPRTIMAIDNVIRTLIIGLIPILYWFGLLELWLLFLLTFLAGMLVPATEVGSRSILPDLVDDKDLDAANMLWSFSLNLSLVIGPAVAGVLVASFGGPSVLLIDAGTFAVMAFVAITLPLLKRSKPPVQAPLSERLGLRQLWDMKVMRYTTLLSLVFFFSYGPLEAALPLYSDAILQTDARGYGLLWSALAVGALIGTPSSTMLSRRLRLGVALPLIAVLWGAILLPMAFTNHLWLACGLLFLGGLMWGPYTPMETTLLQRNIPKSQLGRVFGARSTLLTGGSPLGLAIGGILLAFVPSTSVIAFSAMACILVGLGGLNSPTFRGLSLPSVDP